MVCCTASNVNVTALHQYSLVEAEPEVTDSQLPRTVTSLSEQERESEVEQILELSSIAPLQHHSPTRR